MDIQKEQFMGRLETGFQAQISGGVVRWWRWCWRGAEVCPEV
jgi:hypothetical protein